MEPSPEVADTLQRSSEAKVCAEEETRREGSSFIETGKTNMPLPPHDLLILRGIHKCLYLVVLLTELVKTSVPHELGVRCYLVKPNLNSNVLSLNKDSCRAESTC